MGNRHWTNKEIEIIKQSFHVMPDFATANLLPGRSVCAIACKRRALNLKYIREWMNEQMKITRISPFAFC